MKYSLLVSLTFLCAKTLACQEVSDNSSNSWSYSIDSLIGAKAPREFNGVVLISQNGRNLYSKAVGIVDSNTGMPLQVADRFSTMSIAKQVTATLILQQVQRGTIDLHVPIRRYMPNMKFGWADTITVHHLLNNTSGLASFDINKPLKFVPGTNFNYSNVGYSIAGQILEQQSGQTFSELVKALFAKCDMRSSGYYDRANQKLLVKGHTVQADGSKRVNDRISFAPGDYFGSHLVVTAEDLSRWNECLHNGKLLQPATYAQMINYSVTAVHSLFSEKSIGYGYGLRINDKQALKEYGHTGFHPSEGFTAVNLYYPESQVSVIVLENVGNENFELAYYYEEQIRKIILESGLVEKHKPLKDVIEGIISKKKATLGLSLKSLEGKETLSINGSKMMPMMSVFKFHIALAILNQVDRGKLRLQQRFLIKRDSIHPNTWSPMREEYPEGDVYFTLDQLLKYTVSHSDNNGCDILIDIAGGTAAIQSFIRKQGIQDCVIRLNEQQMRSWDNLYVNSTTPLASTALLERFFKGAILREETTKYLYNLMVETTRGVTWMKAGLPAGTEFAHRTGISGTNAASLRAAMNDVGIITLPNGTRLILSIFLMNISEDRETTEKVFSDITRAVWENYTQK